MKRRLARGLALWISSALVSLAACATFGGVEPIDVNVVSLTPLPSTAYEHRLRVGLRLRNPNDRAYQIDGVRFVLDVNGRRLASGVSDQKATLPRLGEAVVSVTTTTSLLDIVNQLVTIGEQSQRERPSFDYQLRGRIFVAHSWGGLDFERKGSTQDWGVQPAAAR